MSIEGEPMEILTGLSDALAGAIERIGPSIVRVEARRQRSQGTGVIWDTAGLVVTADHVLERGEDITVVLPDGRSLPANIIGRDADRDIGLIRIPTDGFPAIPRGERPRVGHIVLAVGRLNDRVMATMGLVSAVRPSGKRRGGPGASLIQTDALFYPGFSGGPLLDATGRMVGLNSSRSRAGAGMAVALDAVVETAATLLAGGKVSRGYIGLVTQSVRLPPAFQDRLGVSQEGGLLVLGVEAGSPADAAGLLLGDVLLALDGQSLQEGGDLRSVLTTDRIGEQLTARVIRGGELRDLAVVVGER